MKLRVVALDYDGTIAVDGHLDPDVRAAIVEVRARGVTPVLVTGRILGDLRHLVGDLRLFDAVVAENGAVLAFPHSGRSALLAARASAELVRALEARGASVRAGLSVVELAAADAPSALAVIRALELPLVCHFNRDRLMILPQAVSKATGLREALRILRLSPHNAVAIGDAENDHELLASCEVGAAVAWGSAILRSVSDDVVAGTGPSAVAPYLLDLTAHDRIVLPPTARRRLVLGRGVDGSVVSLAVRGRNVLVAGDPRSGKSWVAGLLCEQLLAHRYSLCVLDPEGDYQELESLPGVIVLGGDDPPPSMHHLSRTLRHADVSVVVDLARLEASAKRDYVETALATVTRLRRETGVPHRIVVDEAHYFLGDRAQSTVLDAQLAGYTLITYRVGGLHADVLSAAECIVVTRETDPTEIELLHRRFGGGTELAQWHDVLSGLELDEAVLLPVGEEAAGQLRRFRIAPRLTRHVRHRHKYLDVCVREPLAFHFAGWGGQRGPVARTLQQLVDILRSSSDAAVSEHAQRGDLSRWIEQVIGDVVLAGEVRDLEERFRLSLLPDFCGAVAHVVTRRYQLVDDLI